ncbi:MFS transporter [Luedemannella flava]|uniref:MFS transporter n=1 Tax=Luedemannella flava TaxID=349316 RepID=A0ABN2MI50_9ACTN
MRARHLGMDLTPLRTCRDFRLVFVGSGVSSLGSFITYITIPFQVAELTDSPVMVGLLGLVELVPLLFMAFIGGALADFLDRRRLIIYGELAFTLLTAVLLVNAQRDEPHLWVLFVVAGVTTAIDGIQRPAMDSIIPRLVPPEQLAAAGALNSARMNIASLGGPALAGVLLASVGSTWIYAIDLATFAVSLACLAFVRAVPPPPAAERPSLRSVVTGLRYAKSRPELLGTYLVDINAMFFGMPQALYPFVAKNLGGPAVLGLLYAAPSAGALLATLTSRWTGRVHRHGLMVVLAAAAWGLAIVGFGVAAFGPDALTLGLLGDRDGYSGILWLALLFLVLAGAADMISGVFRSVIWNQTIPDRLRGRLAGIEMLSYSIGPTLGNVESGVAARFAGTGGSIVLGGVLCVLGTGALAAALPAFVRYDGREGLARKIAEDEAWAARVAGNALPETPAVTFTAT